MLANITSYFWGNESEETPCVEENEEKCEKVCDNVPVTTVTAKPSETATLKTTTPQEDDWVMVHRSANCKSPVLEEKQEETEQQENNQTPQQMEEAANRTAGVTSRAANLLQAIDVLRPQQKAQRRREERRLKHKHLIYGNKVREVASAGNGRSRRCHMMTPEKFSRAVNNRKC